MRLRLLCGVLAVAVAPAFAAVTKDEAKRFTEASVVLTELRNAGDAGVPEDLWKKAECVVVIPSLKKGAFVVGGEYGAGVMSCRTANAWGAPVFMRLAKGSWGLQIGGQEIDLVLLIMNRRGVNKLLEDKISLGADASVAAGPVGRSAHAATDAQMSAEMLSYSRAQGVFAGIDVSGGVLQPDKEADARAYGPEVSARAVIDGGSAIHAPVEAQPFLKSLSESVDPSAL